MASCAKEKPEKGQLSVMAYATNADYTLQWKWKDSNQKHARLCHAASREDGGRVSQGGRITGNHACKWWSISIGKTQSCSEWGWCQIITGLGSCKTLSTQVHTFHYLAAAHQLGEEPCCILLKYSPYCHVFFFLTRGPSAGQGLLASMWR